jgi:hypothetical protein
VADEGGRLTWNENERGLHLTLRILDETYSATGVTMESALEVMVLALADTLERLLALERGDNADAAPASDEQIPS